MSDEELKRVTERYNSESALKQARTRSKGESMIKKTLGAAGDILYTGSKQLVENAARNAGQELGKRMVKSALEKEAENYDRQYKVLKNKHDVELANKGIFRDNKGDGSSKNGPGEKREFNSPTTLGKTFKPKDSDSSSKPTKKSKIDEAIERAETKRRDDAEKKRYRDAMAAWVKELDDREADKALDEMARRYEEKRKLGRSITRMR